MIKDLRAIARATLLRWLGAGLWLWIAGCSGALAEREVEVTLEPLSPAVVALQINAALDGKAARQSRQINHAAARFRVQVPLSSRGALRIEVGGLDQDGCQILTGSGALELPAVGDAALTIGLDGPPTPRCSLELTSVSEPPGDRQGRVTRRPEGRSCGLGCWRYRPGTIVTLAVQPEPGSYFEGWSGDCAGRDTCTLTIDNQGKHARAAFISPRVCTSEQLCWEHPLPTGVALRQVRAAPQGSKVVWILGEEDMVLRWDGEQWNAAQGLQYSDGLFKWWQPDALAVTSTGDAVVAGAKGIFLRSVNVLWWPLPQPLLGDPHFRGVAALDVANGWAVGVNAQGDGGVIAGLRAGAPVQQPQVPTGTKGLYAVHSLSTAHAVAVGENGTILRWRGESWLPERSGSDKHLRALSGTEQDLWAVGDRGVTLRSSGSGPWSTASADATINLVDVWHDPTGETWAVAAAPAQGAPEPLQGLRRWDGKAFVAGPKLPIQGVVRSVSGDSSGQGWAVSSLGEILRWDGKAWNPRSEAKTFQDLLGVWSSDREHVWAVGRAGTALRWDGVAWEQEAKNLTQRHLAAVWGSSANDLWAVGEKGTVLRKQGDEWRSLCPEECPQELAESDLVAVWGSGPDDVWLVGAERLFHFKDRRLQPHALPPIKGLQLRAVWGHGATTVWVVGSVLTAPQNPPDPEKRSCLLLHFDGEVWVADQRTASVYNAYLGAVFGSGEDDVWAAGKGGLMLHKSGPCPCWDGTCQCWRQEPAPSSDINALWGSGPDDVWATSSTGAALLRWNGRDWLPVVRSKLHQVRGVSGSGPGDVWFVGERGAILRYRP